MRRAVITGIGPIAPVGTGVDAFWQGMLAERSAIGLVGAFDASPFAARCSAEIRDFDPAVFFPPHRLKRLDRYAQFAVASSYLALRDAGLDPSADSPDPRFGVSFGTALGGISHAEAEHARYLKEGPKAVSRALALQVFGGSAHSNIAIEFGLQGPGTTNANSCASGNVALGDALRFIQLGKADAMLAGGAEAPLSPLTFGAFDNIKTMSRFEGDPPCRACRPFDRGRDGFVMGEGAATFVLEELERAKARGARIYAEICGFSLNNEAFHMTSPRPGAGPVTRAMREALDDAHADPGEVDLISAHASSTQLNDSNECEAIRIVFGSGAERIPITGWKAFNGHALGAAGSIEAAIGLLAMERGFLPPTLHLDAPDDGFAGLDFVGNAGRETAPQTFLNNAFGFGGINSCVVFRSI